MNKTKKSVLITGAATGIGRSTALRFAAEGWFVGLYDVNALGLKQLAAELGASRATHGVLDVGDAAAFEQAAQSFFTAAGGRLDVLINNAGILSCGRFEELPASRHEALLRVNALGVVNGCRAAHPYLKQTPGARVVNLSSASAIYGSPDFATYSATKFFVRGLTEALNLEWRGQGIGVCDVMPLFVDTPMLTAVNYRPPSVDKLGVRLSAEDIAKAVYRAATSRRLIIHHYPNAQTRALALAANYLPGPVFRLSTRLMSGH